ncbi:hypothetical protein DYB32_004629 [Aphanomyces invadans]|uniref:Kinesin motor domain-containing protein n=1 Tax=Aphanomyces invadans TaxID=157072 RepID=A0A418AX17_9STRA|nr:hypothetical protein DYB32_004629 [Aphanomyces invadans]
MDAQRALLDELMGRNRDGDKPEEDISDFRDSRVCKRFLCGLCPHDLFQNTKMDMGDCEKLHLPKLKVAYEAEKAKPNPRDYGYENDLLRELERYVSDVEKKISRAQKRLEEQEGARPPTLADIENNKEVLEITAEIADLMQKAEDAGNEGEVDLSMELMAQVEALKAKKIAVQANTDASGPSNPVVNEYDATQLHLMNVLPGNPLAMTNVNNKLQAADGSFAFHAARESTMTADDCVQVCVRIRPTSKKEQAAIASNNCIRVMPSPKPPTQLVVGKDRPFTFDSIHTVDTTQEALYATSVTSLGYNATVLAYGQTGTGKTFTMTGGAAYSAKLQDSHGVIPRAVCHVFQLMHARQQVSECLLRVEYVEIYNEELRDLLHPETSSKNLSIREDADGHIVVTGAKSQAVQTPDDVMRLLSMGSAARVTGSTQMNEQSSRSHAIFTLVLQQKRRDSGQLTHAKFHLVDLAGSERAKRTGAVGGRFKESVNINQGLLALGNVISALGDDAKKKAHVPYRDSKLTRLLQDSLGGNSKTLMIACVSPVAANFDETLNTLKYANRAKNIKNRPVVNHVKEADTDDTILRMKEEIQMLQRQLVTTPPVAVAAPEEHDQQLLHEWTAKVQALQRAVQTAKSTAKEGATALVALERDIKALGRPVQQRLNDVVKLLNSIVLLQHDSPATPINGADDLPHNNAHEYRAEINALHDKLKQDVEIFELKSKEMEQLQRQMAQAHKELEALRAMNQQLQMATTVACATPRRRDVEGATNQSGDSMDRKAVSLFAKRHSVDDDDSVLMADPELTTETIHAMNSKLHATGSPDPEELSRLKRRKDRAEKKLALFVQKMESQSYVDPAVQDELSALEEQIEDLNSQILFQDSQLESAQAQVPESTAIDQVLKHVATSGAAIDPKLKTWIQMCWTEIKAVQATLQLQDEMVVQLTQNREQLENGLNAARAEYDRRLLQNELLQASDKKHMDELVVLLADKQNQIDALRATEKRLTEYDRYVSERQAEWEAKLAEVQRTLEVERVAAQASIDDLRQQLAQVQRVQAAPVASPSESELAALKEKLQTQQEYVVNLEKHVLLFKNKAKQAQQQLQQLIRDSAGNQNNDEDNPRIKQLEDMNEALMKENAAMKVHLRAMKGPDPSDPHFRVRIPKAELIEVELPTPVPQSSEQQ